MEAGNWQGQCWSCSWYSPIEQIAGEQAGSLEQQTIINTHKNLKIQILKPVQITAITKKTNRLDKLHKALTLANKNKR